MTDPIVGIYKTEKQARSAMTRLRKAGLAADQTLLVTPGTAEGADQSEALSTALQAGQLLGARAAFYAERVQQGRALVVVSARFGQAARVNEILNSSGSVDAEMQLPSTPDLWGRGAPLSAALGMPVLQQDRPAPLSDSVGIPTLSRQRRFMSWLFGELASPHFSLSSLLGLGTLIHNPAPLSSLLGLSTLKQIKRPWTTSLGLPLLSSGPAPLSSAVGMPLLSHGPSPLSSAIGLRVLTDKV